MLPFPSAAINSLLKSYPLSARDRSACSCCPRDQMACKFPAKKNRASCPRFMTVFLKKSAKCDICGYDCSSFFNHRFPFCLFCLTFTLAAVIMFYWIAGWSSQVAHWAHNPKVAGSNPAPATNSNSVMLRRLRRSIQRCYAELYAALPQDVFVEGASDATAMHPQNQKQIRRNNFPLL